MKKKVMVYCAVFLFLASPAIGSALKVWLTGETLRAADLNSNFAHIHTTKVGDGVLLSNADIPVNTIAHTKLVTPALVPKISGWVAGGAFATACSADPCTLYANTGISSVNWGGTGTYTVNFAARPDSQFMVHVTALNALATETCQLTGVTTTTALIACVSHAGVGAHAAADAAFSFLLMDNN